MARYPQNISVLSLFGIASQMLQKHNSGILPGLQDDNYVAKGQFDSICQIQRNNRKLPIANTGIAAIKPVYASVLGYSICRRFGGRDSGCRWRVVFV